MGVVRIVGASAGSGKTYNLAYEFIRTAIGDPSLYNHILAVTFTNKATEEMKSRILGRIGELAAGGAGDYLEKLRAELNLTEEEIRHRAGIVHGALLHDYSRFAVMTIDRFFQRIVRSFVREFNLDADFAIELSSDELLAEAADRLVDDMSTDPVLRDWIMGFVQDRMEDGAQWNVRSAIVSLGKSLFGEDYRRGAAPADKKRVQRYSRALVAAAQRAEKDMTAKAREILALASGRSLAVEDFINGAQGPMGWVAALAEGEIKEYGTRVVAARDDGRWRKASHPRAEDIDALAPQLCERLVKLCRAYDDGTRLRNTASIVGANYRNYALLSDLRTRIDEICREKGILHISEVNDLLRRLTEENDAPFVYEKAGNYFSHFMIDEFQDTSAMQWENFVPLLRNAAAQSAGPAVMLVGDVKQSIYRWRGGDWSILGSRAAEKFIQVERETLAENYRSRSVIVSFNNTLISRCAEADNETADKTVAEAAGRGLLSAATAAGLTGTVARAYADCRQSAATGTDDGYVTVTDCDADDVGARIITLIDDLQDRGHGPEDIAILVRTNSEASTIASLLLERKRSGPDNGHVYDVVTQEALAVGAAPVCRFAAACLALTCFPDEPVRRAVYNLRLGRPLDAAIPEDESGFLAELRLRSPLEAFERIVIRYSLGDDPAETAFLQAMHDELISCCSAAPADIPAALEWWEHTGRRRSIAMSPGGRAITIATVHKSKGLAFPVVVLPYCNWAMTPRPDTVMWAPAGDTGGLFPVKFTKETASSYFSETYYKEYVLSHVDNLNVLYVAVTRARDELHIFLPRQKKKESGKIDTLVRNAVGIESADEGEAVCLTFGEPLFPRAAPPDRTACVTAFRSWLPSERIRTRFDCERYALEGTGDPRMSPRERGVLMHRLFQCINSRSDVDRALETLRADGTVSEEESRQLREEALGALDDPQASRWFDGSWDEIRNENEIIVPGGSAYRPDRVMMRSGETVAVDYKFGTVRSAGHLSQIRGYMRLLKDMGCPNVSGYVWYVTLGQVEKA